MDIEAGDQLMATASKLVTPLSHTGFTRTTSEGNAHLSTLRAYVLISFEKQYVYLPVLDASIEKLPVDSLKCVWMTSLLGSST